MICVEGQKFGENLNGSYVAGGLKGHSGLDFSCGFGSPIISPFDGYVYKVLTPKRPASDGFTGVFMLVDNGIESFEWLVGHCDPTVAPGMNIKKGDVLGTEANHGTVYSGNIRITLAMQAAGDQRGHHRHDQKRPYMRTKNLTGVSLSIEDGMYYDGYYYQVWDYYNGYNGCIDPSKPLFTRDLWLGSKGYDVYCLQRFLALRAYFNTEPTGYYGPITLAAVSKFQADHNILPVAGYCGTKTRTLLNTLIPTPSSTPK